MAFFIQFTDTEYGYPIYYRNYGEFADHTIFATPFDTKEDAESLIASQEDEVAYEDRQLYLWTDVEIKSDE